MPAPARARARAPSQRRMHTRPLSQRPVAASTHVPCRDGRRQARTVIACLMSRGGGVAAGGEASGIIRGGDGGPDEPASLGPAGLARACPKAGVAAARSSRFVARSLSLKHPSPRAYSSGNSGLGWRCRGGVPGCCGRAGGGRPLGIGLADTLWAAPHTFSCRGQRQRFREGGPSSRSLRASQDGQSVLKQCLCSQLLTLVLLLLDTCAPLSRYPHPRTHAPTHPRTHVPTLPRTHPTRR